MKIFKQAEQMSKNLIKMKWKKLKNSRLFVQVLYTDILKAYFVYTEQEQYIKYKLYFKKKIFGEIKDIPTSIESSGTKQILELVPF